jgi:hypothetical protein
MSAFIVLTPPFRMKKVQLDVLRLPMNALFVGIKLVLQTNKALIKLDNYNQI